MTRPYGMAKVAFDAIIGAFAQAGINPEKTTAGGKRIVQTVGSAKASAGTHAKDGTDEHGFDYAACVDISVKHDLTDAQINDLLIALWHHGFAAWHRDAPEFPGNEHIHAIYAGVKMARLPRAQVHDFLGHRSGLVSDKTDRFVRDKLTDTDEQIIRALFLSKNPATG